MKKSAQKKTSRSQRSELARRLTTPWTPRPSAIESLGRVTADMKPLLDVAKGRARGAAMDVLVEHRDLLHVYRALRRQLRREICKRRNEQPELGPVSLPSVKRMRRMLLPLVTRRD